MTGTRQYCTFSLGTQYFGLDVLQVKEIVRPQSLTKVPLAHPVVMGLINLRGQIVTAIDLRKRLGLPPCSAGTRPINVVVQSADGAISLQVDEIGDVLEVDEQLFEPPPETLRGPARELIIGAYKLSDRLLVILDPARVVEIPQ